MVELQQFAVHARSLVKTLKMRFGNELYQIAIARFIFCKKHEPPLRLVHIMLFVVPRAGSEKKIDADDGFDVGFFAHFIKFDGGVEIAVVGKRERLLSFRFCSSYELGYFWQCFKKRVMTMRMKVYEITRTHRVSISLEVFHILTDIFCIATVTVGKVGA